MIAFQQKPKMAKADLESESRGADATHGVVVDYASATRAARARTTRKSFDATRELALPRKRMVTAKNARRADVAVAR